MTKKECSHLMWTRFSRPGPEVSPVLMLRFRRAGAGRDPRVTHSITGPVDAGLRRHDDSDSQPKSYELQDQDITV